MPSTISLLDWFTIAAYILLIAGISLYQSRKIRTQDDVLLAGRSMSRWPIALSMYMSLFSTNTFVGNTGWLNRPDGTIWIGLRNLGMMCAVPLIVWLYPALFIRLRISTAYEYLEKRFNYSVRGLAACFFLAARVMWMATMLYSSGLVLSMLLGWTEETGQIAAMGMVAAMGTFFALAGGMHAVIWTDVVQFFIMMTGVVVIGIFGIVESGGVTATLVEARDAGKFDLPPAFSLTADLSIFSALLLGFIEMLSSSGSDQVVLQTYLTARSEKEAKKSLWRNGLLLKPLSLLFPLLGLVMFVYYRHHPDIAAHVRVPDDALAVFITHVLPRGLRGLMVMSILCAVVDSIASGMAASSAVIQVDFIRRFRDRALSDRAAVLMARVVMLAWGVLIMGVALWVRELGKGNSIIQILNIIMYPFSGVLLGVFLLGLLTRRTNGPGVLIGGAAGFLMTVAVPLSGRLLSSPDGETASRLEWLQRLGQISDFYFGALGVGTTILLGYAASHLFAPPGRAQTQGLTRFQPPIAEPR